MPGNPAGGATNGRIDGAVTQGPNMPGDDVIKEEDVQNSRQEDQGICKGC
jgi:hypothetical protein